MNHQHAYNFLSSLGQEFWFQTLNDFDKEDKSLVSKFRANLTDCWPRLDTYSSRGASVHVTINASGDNGKTKADITQVRAIFLDLDGSPIPSSLFAEPTFINESSEGNFHIFWMVEAGFPLEKFPIYQMGLAKLYAGDLQVANVNRNMRIPGYWHRKDIERPFLSRVVHYNPLARYGFATIEKAFPAAERLAKIGTMEQRMRDIGKRKIAFGDGDFEKALKKAYEAILATDEGSGKRNRNLNSWAYWLGTIGVEYQTAYDTLLDAGLSIGLTQYEVESTLRCAIAAGLARKG